MRYPEHSRPYIYVTRTDHCAFRAAEGLHIPVMHRRAPSPMASRMAGHGKREERRQRSDAKTGGDKQCGCAVALQQQSEQERRKRLSETRRSHQYALPESVSSRTVYRQWQRPLRNGQDAVPGSVKHSEKHCCRRAENQ